MAGLGPEVTPHCLRHTCATWMMQRRVPRWEVVGYLGISEKARDGLRTSQSRSSACRGDGPLGSVAVAQSVAKEML
ncbi:MAG: hypothetical protein JO068_22920 [Hyphomicrobiales bacterium]|nr:hypothetical protein [Hyphomicrobiales bacterium]